jgi:hypothetical protein
MKGDRRRWCHPGEHVKAALGTTWKLTPNPSVTKKNSYPYWVVVLVDCQ